MKVLSNTEWISATVRRERNRISMKSSPQRNPLDICKTLILLFIKIAQQSLEAEIHDL